MRKTLLSLSAAVLLAAQAPVFAADLTVQQKFEDLKAQGIFAGIDGQAALDQNMNRAQFARVSALILGLQQDSTPSATFSDVAPSAWYSGFVNAAAKAGLIDGMSGKFQPHADISMQELAALVVKVGGLNVDSPARVPGADSWASPYIAAAIEAGLVSPAGDYTQAATRAQLVDAAYRADPSIRIPTQEEIAAQVIGDAVKQYPDQAASIVADAIKANPSQAALITQAAIKAAPSQAGAITKAAIEAAPEQAQVITDAAIQAAPEQTEAIQTAAGSVLGPQSSEPGPGSVASPVNNSTVPGSSSGGGGDSDPVASPANPNI